MKKFIYIISIIIIIAIIAGGIVFFINNKKPEEKIINQEESVENDNTTSFHKTQTIESTEEKSISKDSIEATKINIYKDDAQIRVEATLKNISDKPINGFFIEIALLDKKGNTVTTVAENSTQKIDVGKSYLFTSNVVGSDYSNIASAKISTFEPNINQDINEQIKAIENSVH